MKTSIKDSTMHFWLKMPLLLAVLQLIAGCATLGRNPLEGWTELGSAYVLGSPFGEVVADDYRDYIRRLPAKERIQVDDFTIRFYDSATGERAVKISTISAGFWSDIRWEHVLIYDATGKRFRTVKFKSGRSLS
jgi:hypothetical protein